MTYLTEEGSSQSRPLSSSGLSSSNYSSATNSPRVCSPSGWNSLKFALQNGALQQLLLKEATSIGELVGVVLQCEKKYQGIYRKVQPVLKEYGWHGMGFTHCESFEDIRRGMVEAVTATEKRRWSLKQPPTLMSRLVIMEQQLMAAHDKCVENDAPTGHLTLVFTDVQASTSLWEKSPNSMKQALFIHNKLMRRLIHKWGGYEVKTEGDAFMCSFSRTSVALHWAMDLQNSLIQCEWPQEILAMSPSSEVKDPSNSKTILFNGLRVRVGIHSGEPDNERDPVTGRCDYFGKDVNMAARVSGLARGGETLLSTAAYRDLQKQGALPDKLIHLVPQGAKKLKGIVESQEVFSVLPVALNGRDEYWSEKHSDNPKLSGSWARRIGMEWQQKTSTTINRRRKISVLEYKADRLHKKIEFFADQLRQSEMSNMQLHDTFTVAVKPSDNDAYIMHVDFKRRTKSDVPNEIYHNISSCLIRKSDSWNGFVSQPLTSSSVGKISFWNQEDAVRCAGDIHSALLSVDWSSAVMKNYPISIGNSEKVLSGPAVQISLGPSSEEPDIREGLSKARSGETIAVIEQWKDVSANVIKEKDSIHLSVLPTRLSERWNHWGGTGSTTVSPSNKELPISGGRRLSGGKQLLSASSFTSNCSSRPTTPKSPSTAGLALTKRDSRLSELVRANEILEKKDSYIGILKEKEETRRQQHDAELREKDRIIAELEAKLEQQQQPASRPSEIIITHDDRPNALFSPPASRNGNLLSLAPPSAGVGVLTQAVERANAGGIQSLPASLQRKVRRNSHPPPLTLTPNAGPSTPHRTVSNLQALSCPPSPNHSLLTARAQTTLSTSNLEFTPGRLRARRE